MKGKLEDLRSFEKCINIFSAAASAKASFSQKAY